MAKTLKLSEKMSQSTEIAEIKRATLDDLKKLPLKNKDVKNALSASVVKVEEMILSQKDIVSGLSEAKKIEMGQDISKAILTVAGSTAKAQELLRLIGDELEIIGFELSFEETVDSSETIPENTETLSPVEMKAVLGVQYDQLATLPASMIPAAAANVLLSLKPYFLPATGEALQNDASLKKGAEEVIKILVAKAKNGDKEPTFDEYLTFFEQGFGKAGVEFPTEKFKKENNKIKTIQDENRENFESSDVFSSIDLNLRNFLDGMNDTPTIKKIGGIGYLVEQARLTNPENPKEALKESLKKLVFEEIQRWAETNLKAIQEQTRREARDDVSSETPEFTGIATSRITQIAEWAGKFSGQGAVTKYEHIAANPFLFSVLGKDLAEKAEAQLQTGNFVPSMYESIVSSGVDNLLANASFESIAANYRVLKIDGEERTDEDIDIMINKLEGVGKEYWGTKYEKNYKKYVENTGPAAQEFDEWIGKQEMSPMQRFVFWIKGVLGGMGLFKNGEFSIGNMLDDQKESTESEMVKGLRERRSDFVSETSEDADEVDFNLPPEFSYLKGKVETTSDDAVKIEELPESLFVDEEKGAFKPAIKQLFSEDLDVLRGDFVLGKPEFELLAKWEKADEIGGFEADEDDEFYTSSDLEKEKELEDGKKSVLHFERSGMMNDESFDSMQTFFAWMKAHESELDD